MLSEGYLKYGFIICGNDMRTLIVDLLVVQKFLEWRLKSVRIKKAHKTSMITLFINLSYKFGRGNEV